MKLVSSGSRRWVLLAPARSVIPSTFSSVQSSPSRHRELLLEMQELRGRVYLEDGALQPSQLNNGRHSVKLDEDSWHLLVLEDNQVRGCIRCREHSVYTDPQELTVSHSALARSVEWERPFEAAVRAELALARRLGYRVVEAGGLALDQEIRGTTEALRLALGMYALCQQLGGAVGLSTVTQRHCSASILRRIGGRPMESNGWQLPPYYDPHYDCQMEIMRFYSWEPNPRYRVWVEDLTAEIGEVNVFAPRGSGQNFAYHAYAASRGLR
jgi:hypothetical protein